MTKKKTPLPPTTSSTLEKTNRTQATARGALRPSLNSALVIRAYQGNIVGKDVDIVELAKGLQDSFQSVNLNDLSKLEEMLVGQATALQTMFVHLAQRALQQEQMAHLDAFMNMAFKAQSQSRATISALVDLKFPRQATFVKQANIANGPLQVNNGMTASTPESHASKNLVSQNKLLAQDTQYGSTYLDARTEATTARPNSGVATVEKVYRSNE